MLRTKVGSAPDTSLCEEVLIEYTTPPYWATWSWKIEVERVALDLSDMYRKPPLEEAKESLATNLKSTKKSVREGERDAGALL